MDTEFSRNKKKEISELLANHNQLRSQQEFDEIKYQLHEACKKGDLELIEIYLSGTIENETNDLTFKINKTNKTASLFKINKHIHHLIVPTAVKHESDEYLITSIILINNFNSNIKTIKFEEDSSISTIYSNAFSSSKIEEIYLPKSLKELKEGWCHNTKSLKKKS